MHTSRDEWFLAPDGRTEWPTDVATGTLLDAIPDAFYAIDRRGRFVEWNDRFREVTGYADEEIVDLDPLALVAEESEPDLRELLASVVDGAEGSIEASLVTADGERVHKEFTAAPLTDDDGDVWGMAGTVRDGVSHRTREELLSDLHESARELLAAETERQVADAAVRVAHDRFDCATAGVRLLEGDRLEMVAVETDDERLDEYLPPYEVGEGFVGEAYERAEAVVHDDLRELAPDIDYGPARSVVLLPIPGHGMINLAATEVGAFDETELELARVFAADVEAALERVDRERRLRERKRDLERYEILVETIGDGVYMTDADNRVTMVNDAATELLGLDRDALLGISVDDFGKRTAAEKEAERQKLLAGEQSIGRLSENYEREDGEELHLENRFSLLPGEGFQGTVGVIRDVTEQREREQLLHALHETSRALMTAETKTEVAQQATQTADRIGFGSVAVRLLEGDRLTVVARATDDDRFERIEMPDYEVGEGLVGGAYEAGEPVVYDDAAADVAYDVGPMGSVMLLPIPGHGMISIASAEVGAFDETDLELGRVFAADVEAALERADREQQLRERKRDLERYETLVETISDGVYMTDAGRRVTMVNEALTDMVGYEHGDLIGATPSVVADDDAIESADRLIRELHEGKRSVATHETELETADGQRLPVENRISLMPGEGFQGTVGVVRDVTERRRREEQLKRSHEELARLNRINELIQETIHALASTATREEIEATVCQQLADSEFYRFALTADLARSEGVVEHSEWAGEGADYLDAFEVTATESETGRGPGGRAVRTGDVQVCQDISTDPQFEPWRGAALENGFHSVAVVPLGHGETIHGILAVYAGEADAFGQRELRALEVLGDMIGFAISAIQNQRLIQADQVQEFEFAISEREILTAGITETLGCQYRLLGIASTADPGMLHYVAFDGVSTDELFDALEAGPDAARLEDIRIVSADESSCVVEARVAGSVAEVLQESGVQPIEAVAADGELGVVARGPRDLDLRTLLDTLESTHGDVELRAKREVDADVRADRAIPDRIDDRLTDRQSAALNAAYFSGYFDWPRDSTAEEVADALGISSATLHQHLRHAQRKLIEASFVDGSERRT